METGHCTFHYVARASTFGDRPIANLYNLQFRFLISPSFDSTTNLAISLTSFSLVLLNQEGLNIKSSTRMSRILVRFPRYSNSAVVNGVFCLAIRYDFKGGNFEAANSRISSAIVDLVWGKNWLYTAIIFSIAQSSSADCRCGSLCHCSVFRVVSTAERRKRELLWRVTYSDGNIQFIQSWFQILYTFKQ